MIAGGLLFLPSAQVLANAAQKQRDVTRRRARVLRWASCLAYLAAGARHRRRRAADDAACHQPRGAGRLPRFYHGRPIVIVGKVAPRGERPAEGVSDDEGSIHIVFKGNAPDGLDEVRGEFWDLGG